MKLFTLLLLSFSTPLIAGAAEINLSQMTAKYFPNFNGQEIVLKSPNSNCKLTITQIEAPTSSGGAIISFELAQGSFKERFTNDIILKKETKAFDIKGRVHLEGYYTYTSFFGNDELTTLTKGMYQHISSYDPADRSDDTVSEQKVAFANTAEGVGVYFSARNPTGAKATSCQF